MHEAARDPFPRESRVNQEIDSMPAEPAMPPRLEGPNSPTDRSDYKRLREEAAAQAAFRQKDKREGPDR